MVQQYGPVSPNDPYVEPLITTRIPMAELEAFLGAKRFEILRGLHRISDERGVFWLSMREVAERLGLGNGYVHARMTYLMNVGLLREHWGEPPEERFGCNAKQRIAFGWPDADGQAVVPLDCLPLTRPRKEPPEPVRLTPLGQIVPFPTSERRGH